MELKDIFSEMEKCAQADDKAGFEAHDLSFHNLILTIGGNDELLKLLTFLGHKCMRRVYRLLRLGHWRESWNRTVGCLTQWLQEIPLPPRQQLKCI